MFESIIVVFSGIIVLQLYLISLAFTITKPKKFEEKKVKTKNSITNEFAYLNWIKNYYDRRQKNV